MARIDRVSEGRGASLLVSYPASPVYVGIPLWLGGGPEANYKVGEKVEISYDRHDTSHAVLANGLPAPGGMNGLAFLITVAGFLGLGIVAYVFLLYRRAASKLNREPHEMTASVDLDSSSSVAINLQHQDKVVARLRRTSRQDWDPKGPPRPVLVFGEPTVKSVVAIVDPGSESVAIGRLRRPKSARPEPNED